MNRHATATRPDERNAPVLDVARLRADFPILAQKVGDKPLVYLDNAATTQKPRAVLEAMDAYYATTNANVHRGVHHLSQKATDLFEQARAAVQRFIHAESPSEIVFTRGTTEAINLVASSFGQLSVRAGDEILITGMEHHSNIVPWQLLCERTGAALRVVPITDDGELDLDAFERLLTERTRLVGVVHLSNALGTLNPVERLVPLAHAAGAKVLLDGAQAVSHLPVDVQALGCDFYAFSGHKLYGPTGIGVLYGKRALLQQMPPYQGGGEMIRSVTFEKTTFADPPARFEAGTPDIAGAIGLHAALEYVSGVGLEAIAAHEAELTRYGLEALREVPGVRLVGTARERASVLSFVMQGVHPHDIGTILDLEGVAVRTGHHCAQPVMARFGVPATARASVALYNTRDELDALVRALHKVREVFG
jgi:cysteine desulfurase / selenocysteine lyase